LTTQTVDLVLHNAHILTMDSLHHRAQLVAICGDQIVYVGSDDDIDQFRGTVKRIDCSGQTIIPGFNDAHMHILALASKLQSVDCSPEAVSSIADISSKIRSEASRIPPGAWIKATGYNEFYLDEKRHPTRHDLDQAAPNNPVRLTHRSLHACVLNSLALSMAGITIETPDPAGGMIDRELDSGEPSGLLFGMNAYINEQIIPPASEDELAHGIEAANTELLAHGITSVQDATVRNTREQWRLFTTLKDSGKFKPRLSMMFGMHALTDIQNAGLQPNYGDSRLKLGPMKIIIDEISGQLNPPQEKLNDAVFRAHEAGYQVALHAVEEGTLEAAVIALEYCLERLPREDHRHRIEHCSVCPPHVLTRLEKLAVMVVTQPAFVYYNGERYLKEVPQTQLPWLYRTRSLFDSGLTPAGSSDCPVIQCNPLSGIYTAVTRKTESGEELLPNERITAYEALTMYTLYGAYASFEEHMKGSIEVGKVADMVILSDNLTLVDAEAIKEVGVVTTILGGEVLWQS